MSSSAKLPLAEAQLGIWLGQQRLQKSPIYNTAEYLILPFMLDEIRMLDAIRNSVRESESFCCRYSICDGKPVQIVDVQHEARISFIDFSDNAPTKAHSQACRWMQESLDKTIDLEFDLPYVIALLKVQPGLYYFYMQIHHIANDGFGYSLFYQRVSQYYNRDKHALNTQAFPGLNEYLHEDREYQQSKFRNKDQKFWNEYLSGLDNIRSLNGYQAQSYGRVVKVEEPLSPDLGALLKQFTDRYQTQWSEALLASVFVFWHQKTGQQDISLAFPVMNRMGSKTLRIPCMKMNIIPLRLQLKQGDSFAKILADVQEQLKRTRPFHRYRYEHMKQDRAQRGEDTKIFSAVVNIMPFANCPKFGEVVATVHRLRAGPVEDISFNFVPSQHQDTIALSLEANAEIYNQEMLTRHLSEFHDLLARCLAHPDERCVQNIQNWSVLEGKDFKNPQYDDVLMQLQKIAVFQPEHTALQSELGPLSYSVFYKKLESLSRKLLAKGQQHTEEQVRVAIVLGRSEAAILSIWACIRAEIVYTLLDPHGPVLRNQQILDNFNPHFILVNDMLGSQDWQGSRISFHELMSSEAEADPKSIDQVDPCKPAYVLYTSGSTGKPKGVVIRRRNLSSFVHYSNRVYQINSRDRVLQFAPLHFDASVEEIFVSHCHGARLVLRSDECLQSITHFLHFCDTHKITLLDLPTAYWHELVNYLYIKGQSLPKTIHTVIIGGEKVQQALVDQWHQIQGSSVRLLNSYGPTETTVVASTALAHKYHDLSIGLPLDHLCMFVMDDKGKPVRQGEEGELWIAGDSVGLGYWNMADKKSQNSFLDLDLTLGDRSYRAPCYRTGDLVQINIEGTIEYRGRKDQELKLSGHRISPEEIERVLIGHPQISQAAVVVGNGQKKLLAAFYVGIQGKDEARSEQNSLRAYLAERLPEVMIPRLFLEMAELPKNGSGKIDRIALAENLDMSLEVNDDGKDLTNIDEFDQRVKSLIEDVLQIPLSAADQDLFVAGGQSLQMIQLAARLSSEFDVEISVAAAFANSTLRSMSDYIRNLQTRHASETDQAAGTLGQLEQRICADLEDPLLVQKIQELKRSGHALHWEGKRETILLTGATGFLGRYILADLLNNENREIVCLVRAEHDEHAWQRLVSSFNEMPDLAGLNILENNRHRLKVLAADLTRTQFTLDEQRYQVLKKDVTGIIHNAAEVSVTRSYVSLKPANFDATRNLLHFAAEDYLKIFTYVSTIATAGHSEDGHVVEHYCDFHHGLQDGYQQSKWASEQLAKLSYEAGMPAQTLRLGRITGSKASAYVNAKDLVWQIIAASCRLGRYPQLSFQEPWTPVNYTARLIVSMHEHLDKKKFETSQENKRVYHILPRSLVSTSQLFAWLEDLRLCHGSAPLEDWIAELKARNEAQDLSLLSFFESRHASKLPLSKVSYQQSQLLAELKMSEDDTPQLEAELFVSYLIFAQRSGLIRSQAIRLEDLKLKDFL